MAGVKALFSKLIHDRTITENGLPEEDDFDGDEFEDEEFDYEQDIPDFIIDSSNVYRTAHYIVKQTIGFENHDVFGMVTVSHDTFYARTIKREAEYEAYFGDRHYENGQRVPTMAYTRESKD